MPDLDASLITTITEYLFFSSPEALWQDCKVVVILGSSGCEYRVARAWDIFKDKNVLYVLCGGNPSIYRDESGNVYKEADFMKKYLLSKGVSNEKIICEAKSVNTFENLENACNILAKHQHVGPVGIISAGFHMQRVKSLSEKLDFPHEFVFIPAYGEHTQKDQWFLNEIGRNIVITEYEKGIRHNG